MGKLIAIIRSLPENLCIFLQQTGRLKQLDHFQKTFKFFTNWYVVWNNYIISRNLWIFH